MTHRTIAAACALAATLLLGGCGRDAPPPAASAPPSPIAATAPTTASAVSGAAAPVAPAAAPATGDLGAAVRDALGIDGEAHYFDAAVDLNGDGVAEVVVYAAGPMVCGTGGCPLFVFTPAAAGYRLVSQISVARPPIRVSPRSHQGWRNLVVGIGGGGGRTGAAELKSDGSRYASNPTVPPAEPLADPAGTQVLIAEFGSYKDGKPIPPRLR